MRQRKSMTSGSWGAASSSSASVATHHRGEGGTIVGINNTAIGRAGAGSTPRDQQQPQLPPLSTATTTTTGPSATTASAYTPRRREIPFLSPRNASARRSSPCRTPPPHEAALTSNSNRPAELASSFPRGPARGPVGFRPATSAAPHSYQRSDAIFPPDSDRYSPRHRHGEASPARRRADARKAREVSAAASKAAAAHIDDFEVLLGGGGDDGGGSSGGEGSPTTTGRRGSSFASRTPAEVARLREKMVVAPTESAAALAAAKMPVARAAGGRGGGTGIARLGDLPHIVGLFAGLTAPDIAASYRSFCETRLPDAQPTTSSPNGGGAHVRFEGIEDGTLDVAATWSQIRDVPHTYGGPLVEPALLISFLRHVTMATSSRPPQQFSDALFKETADALIAHAPTLWGTFAAAATAAAAEAKGAGGGGGASSTTAAAGIGAPPRVLSAAQYHLGSPNLRFSHVFAIIAEATAPVLVHRNAANFALAFDPQGTGKVPQHVLLSAGFIRKFVEQRVWKGVQDSWLRVAQVLESLNATRKAEQPLLRNYCLDRRPVDRSPFPGISAFTWAVETFLGSHDRHRAERPGGEMSVRMFGVPLNDIRAVIFGTPELYAVFASVGDLRPHPPPAAAVTAAAAVAAPGKAKPVKLV